MTDQPLPLEIPVQPELPDPNDLPHDGQGNPLGGESKWTAYRGAHQPCGRCVRAIHQGLMSTHPRAASQKRTGPNGVELLCNEHGERQKRRDDGVARHLAGVRASHKTRRR
jgi:hypothetical protein